MKRKSFILIILFAIIVLISSNKYISLKKNVIYAIDVEETLNFIGENSFINKILQKEIKTLKDKKAKELLIKLREEKRAEKERVEEKKRIEAEKKVEAEKKRQRKLEIERTKKLKESKSKEIANGNSKLAYLTFDDGPSVNATPKILDILNEYNIKATFFVLGSNAEKNPELLQRIYNEGHKIGNHSYSHNYDYIYGNVENFLADFKHSENVFKSILGEGFSTNIIRFPGGSFGDKKAPMRKVAVDVGYNYYDWNSLNGDAESVNLNKSYLLNRLRETTQNKQRAIILMHDTDSKMETVETLRESINYLIEEGFNFGVLE